MEHGDDGPHRDSGPGLLLLLLLLRPTADLALSQNRSDLNTRANATPHGQSLSR